MIERIARYLAKRSMKEGVEYAAILRKANGYKLEGIYRGGHGYVYIPPVRREDDIIVLHTHFHTLKPSKTDIETKKKYDIERLCIVLAKTGRVRCY